MATRLQAALDSKILGVVLQDPLQHTAASDGSAIGAGGTATVEYETLPHCPFTVEAVAVPWGDSCQCDRGVLVKCRLRFEEPTTFATTFAQTGNTDRLHTFTMENYGKKWIYLTGPDGLMLTSAEVSKIMYTKKGLRLYSFLLFIDLMNNM